MENKEIRIGYISSSIEELDINDKILIEESRKAILTSFSPHSNFRVGAAAMLNDGTILHGSNQESDVLPAGLCAERVLLFNILSNFKDRKIKTIAISAMNESGIIKKEIFPCGFCTQVLMDAEHRQKSYIRIIMSGKHNCIIIDSAKKLMPFKFTLE